MHARLWIIIIFIYCWFNYILFLHWAQLLLLVQFTREPFHPHLITYTMSQAGLLRSSLLLTNYDRFEGLNGANIHFGFFSAEVWDVAVPDILVILMMLFLDHRYWCSVGAGVDVLAVSCIIDQRQMVVRGQSEMRNASHETSHVLPVSVQRDLLHPTWRSLKSKSPSDLDRYMYTHYHSKLTTAAFNASKNSHICE